MKKATRCAFLKDCYLAEALECYGFKTDCPLYMKSNDEPCNDARFDAAMDQLINSTRARHERLRRNSVVSGAQAAPQAEPAADS